MTTVAKAKIRPLGVLLAPLRWLERARGRRRLLLIVLYLIVGLFAAVLVWVAASLNNLPDVGEPFDVAAFVASAGVPESENAFALYRKAVEAYRDAPPARDWNRMWPAMRNGWATAGTDIQGWVLGNREALDLWRKGTERPRALAEPLDALRSLEDGSLPKLSLLTEAAILEGARREAQGDRAAALDWYLAGLRACVHYSTNSRLEWRNLAVMLEDPLHARMVAWARDPATDAALLKRAARAVAEIDAAAPPVSGNLKAEYLSVSHALDDLPRLARRLDGLGGIDVFLCRDGPLAPPPLVSEARARAVPTGGEAVLRELARLRRRALDPAPGARRQRDPRSGMGRVRARPRSPLRLLGRWSRD